MLSFGSLRAGVHQLQRPSKAAAISDAYGTLCHLYIERLLCPLWNFLIL